MPTYNDVFVSAFEDELEKIAQTKQAAMSVPKPSNLKRNLGVATAGAVGYESLRRANEDRKMGRMVRRQQNQGY